MARRVAALAVLGVLGLGASYAVASSLIPDLNWPDRFEDRLRALEGTWAGAGEIEGMGPVTATLTISRDQGTSFYRCEQVVRTETELLTDYGFFYLRFNARTFRPDLRIIWMHGKGYILQGKGALEPDALVFTLDTGENLPPGVRGRTRIETPQDGTLRLSLEFGVPVSKLQEMVTLNYQRVPQLAQGAAAGSR